MEVFDVIFVNVRHLLWALNYLFSIPVKSASEKPNAYRARDLNSSCTVKAGKLNSIQGIEVDGRQYPVATCVVAPDDTVKGSNSVIILFQGRRVPSWVRYGCVETRCFLHKKKRERNPPNHQIQPMSRAQPCAIKIEGPIQLTEQNSTSSSQVQQVEVKIKGQTQRRVERGGSRSPQDQANLTH
ncbi:hypothetical protein HPB47_019835 [Ixodes persulcatus]|uniref:Uncharacterized protein n=1 Tax=Ixodes persulcatus TaxID=34615 RepID=A0AC60QI09_IXOPE|nr:hypothetical protein HPB47_019835 [Ixodes persulcatus]